MGLLDLLLGKSGINNASASEIKNLLDSDKVLLLDVRSGDEFKTGHLKSARNIPVGSLNQNLSSIQEWKDKKVVVYCHSGGRSQVACQLLKQDGFSNIFNMTGGITSWKQQGYSIK